MGKIVAIIQARMSSTRLPGKILMRLGQKSVLEHVVERVRQCTMIDEVVVATTDYQIDDAIIEECKKLFVNTFRGSSEDVLSRYYGAAKEARAQIVIRITSDCPFIDAEVLTNMLKSFCEKQPDYLSNTLIRTYPRGLDVEVMTFAALKEAHEKATQDYEREHVTPYIYKHPHLFYIEQCVSNEDHSNLRLTLDTEEDLTLIKTVYEKLSSTPFGYNDILKLFMEMPQLAEINMHVEQKKLVS